MEANRVVSYAAPLKDNPEFIVAMRNCNNARDNFVPLRKPKKEGHGAKGQDR